jgi:hypothetical protein
MRHRPENIWVINRRDRFLDRNQYEKLSKTLSSEAVATG